METKGRWEERGGSVCVKGVCEKEACVGWGRVMMIKGSDNSEGLKEG